VAIDIIFNSHFKSLSISNNKSYSC